jgi:hypothetical protein
MNQRARDLAAALRCRLASLGPGVRSIGVDSISGWTIVKIAALDDDVLQAVADGLGLDQARTQRRGRTWFRQVSAVEDGLLVIAAGPHREDAPTRGRR